jgi:hypothetical protein
MQMLHDSICMDRTESQVRNKFDHDSAEHTGAQ